MEEDSNVLLKLIDDPDEAVYQAVRTKIVQLGPEVIPDLEEMARETLTPVVHKRIRIITHKIQFNQLKIDLAQWKEQPFPRLVEGIWIMTRYQFPDITMEEIVQSIKPLRDEIWLELSDQLTAMEKIQVMNRILFDHDRFRLNEKRPTSPWNDFIHRVVETGNTNSTSIALLYTTIAQELGIPLYVVEAFDYPILAYLDTSLPLEEVGNPVGYEILFYVNPAEKGVLFSRDDITNCLIQELEPLDPKSYEPLPYEDMIGLSLRRLQLDYYRSKMEVREKDIEDLLDLWI